MASRYSPSRPRRLDLILSAPPLPKAVQEAHGWNPSDRSFHIYVKEDKLTFHRYPMAQSTDCIRGKIGYTRGFHVWEITWPKDYRGTHAVVGVATAHAPLHSVGYTSLVGSTVESWGWDIGRENCNRLLHNSQTQPATDYPIGEDTETFVVSDTFLVILDMDQGTLAFADGHKYLGVAFRGLKRKKLYPIVSAVYGHSEVSMRYLGGLEPEPLPLTDICRSVIRNQLGNDRLDQIAALDIPPLMKRYLMHDSGA